jgi:hypothetical protein
MDSGVLWDSLGSENNEKRARTRKRRWRAREEECPVPSFLWRDLLSEYLRTAVVRLWQLEGSGEWEVGAWLHLRFRLQNRLRFLASVVNPSAKASVRLPSSSGTFYPRMRDAVNTSIWFYSLHIHSVFLYQLAVEVAQKMILRLSNWIFCSM